MKKLKWLVVAAIGFNAFWATEAKPVSQLLQEAVYQEDTVGDIDAAIDIYRQILLEDQARQFYVAQAMYRLGCCYLKKGSEDKAVEQFKKVMEKFPDRKSIYNRARRELERLRPDAVAAFPVATDNIPHVVKTSPPALANDVSPELDRITVTFDEPMMDDRWSWTGGGDTFPKIDGRVHYDSTCRTCIMPVKLEPGKAYWVGINSPSHKNFTSVDGKTAPRYVICFATRNAQDNVTPIPDDMRARAEDINSRHKPARPMITSPEQIESAVAQAVKTVSTCTEGDPRVQTALDSLDNMAPQMVASELVKYLKSNENNLRRAAVYILWRGELATIAPAVPSLKELCSHPEDLTRGMAALALGQNKVGSAFDLLKDMTLNDKSGYARRCAAYALGTLGESRANPILKKALNDSDPLVQNNARTALRLLNQETAGAGDTPVDRRASEQLAQQGWQLWGQRKLREAEKTFQLAVEKNPENASAWQGLGWSQFNQGKNAQAKAAFLQCIDLDPQNAAALNGLGWIARLEGKTEDAINYWQQAILAAPHATAAYNGLATLYMEQNQHDKAVAVYEQWLRVEPTSEEAKKGLEKARQAGSPSQQEKIDQAARAAKDWLAIVDAGNYEKAWEQSAAYLRSVVGRQAFTDSLKGARSPLGELKARKITSRQYQSSVPGAPDGDYVIIQFETSFANKADAVETITPMLGKEGDWKISGYYIK